METFIQICILCTSLPAGYLVGSKCQRRRRWGFCFGLASQPFWLTSALWHAQWGMLIMCAWYTFTWARGLRNNIKQA